MLDVRPGNGFRVHTVVSDYYCDCGIVSSDAVNKGLKLFITQKGLCGYGNKSADVVICRGKKAGMLNTLPRGVTHSSYGNVTFTTL